MDATERAEIIAQRCRASHSLYTESLITAICQYVTGEGSFSAFQQEWQMVLQGGRSYYSTEFIYIADPRAASLDEIDLRVLDMSIAAGVVHQFFSTIATAGPVEQARDYLRAKGIDESTIIELLASLCNFYDNGGSTTALGRLVLSYLPEQFNEFLKNFPSVNLISLRHSLFKLLSIARPEGYLDMAWQLVQVATAYELDDYAAGLLKADPARFTDWARQVARDTIQNRQTYSSYHALKALLELDPAQHSDLALEAAHAPLPTYRWNDASLQRIGVEAAYRLDPVKYLPLVEEAVVSSNPYLGKHAINLLKAADFEQARPILQHCIASGDVEVALKALDVLLDHEWPERQSYILSLLAHRSKQIRDAIIEQLTQAGESMIETLAPLLTHTNADARLAAVEALKRIGGERVNVLLTARLDVEKSRKIKQAILDVVGTGAVIASDEAAPASPVEALNKEAEAALKRVGKPVLPWFDAAQMPALQWKGSGLVPQAVVNYLLYLQSRVKASKLDERIQQALPLIERSSSGDLALALFNGWLGQGADAKQAWFLPLACALADERLVHPLRQSIDGWTKGTRGAIAAKAVAAMSLIESDLALAEINDLAERAKHSQVKGAAQQALTDAANQRNMTLEELADAIVPNLGFDEHGQRLFDYGPRQFTVRLQLDQTIQITDSAGKRLTALPKPGAHDDEHQAKASQAAWSLLKKQVPQVIKMQTQRLEHALIRQRAWSAARWQALFLKHPVLRSFAITLVWGVTSSETPGYQSLFRPLEDGSLTDAEDNAVELPAEGQIRMVHPIELDEDVRNVWLQHLSDYDVTQPFPQLNRPLVQVQPDEQAMLRWEKYTGYLIDGVALKGRFQKAGWERGAIEDAGVYNTIWKAFPAAGIQAVLKISGLGVGYEQELSAAIKYLVFARTGTMEHGIYLYDNPNRPDERIIKLGEVPPIIFSEAAADIQTFAAAGEYSEDWERKVW